MQEKRSAISAIVSVLVILLIIVAGVAAYAFAYPPTNTVTQTVAGSAQTVTNTVTSTVSGGTGSNALSGLKVGLIVPITAADHSWNYQAEQQIQQLQKEFGFQLSITENKFDGTSAQPVAVQYASSGDNVVILQGIQYMVMANSIAPQYPNTMFVCVDCTVANYSNVYRVWWDMSDAAFVIGLMAGMMTKTNTLGLIGGGRVVSIWGGHEGFKAGALFANPSVKFTEKFEAFSWADSAGAERDANTMYTNGADIVFSSGDGIDVGVIASAMSQPSTPHVWASNVYSNLSAVDPTVDKILLGSIVVNWATLFNKALNDYVSGNWHWGFVTADMQSGIVQVQPGPTLPANVKAAALKMQGLFTLGAVVSYFQTSTTTGDPVCFDTPAQCADTSLSTAAMQFNYLPSLSSL